MATIRGNSGNNNLVGTLANDLIYGYAGNDTLNADNTANDDGRDTLRGGTGNDLLIGDINDRLFGEAGNDRLIANNSQFFGTGQSIYMNGGDGNDYMYAFTAGEMYGGDGNDTITVGTSGIIYGGNGNDVLDGDESTVYGDAGNDTLSGSFSNLYGGTGNDTYIVNDADAVTIYEYEGGGSRDTVRASVSYTLGAYLNDLVLTGSDNINGTGNELDNIITGNSGVNLLQGGAGNDRINADITSNNDGIDTLYGGIGNDSLVGDSGDTLYGDAGNDRLIGNQIGFFEQPGDTIYLYGGDGNDYLNVDNNAGMYGGSGNDTIIGGTSVYIEGGDGNDSLEGSESVIYGGAGNDRLTGSFSSLYGGDGNDVLQGNPAQMFGGRGNDTLIGNNGDDYFGFNAPNEGIDTIRNFSSADFDQIFVSASGFGGGLVAGSTIAPTQFRLGSRAADASDRFIYNRNNGALFFDVDGTGSRSQVQFATLVGTPSLTSDDIFVIT